MSCSCVTYIPNVVVDPGTPDCFRLGTMLLDQCGNAGPCGDTETVDFECFDINCEGTVSMKVYSISDPTKITINSISDAGMSYSTTENAYPNDRIEVVIYGVCNDGDCGIVSDYATIIIYVRDKCKGVVCGSGEVCDYCTGNCEPEDLNLNINNIS